MIDHFQIVLITLRVLITRVQCRVYRSMDRLDEVNTLCGNARDIISAQLDGKVIWGVQ